MRAAALCRPWRRPLPIPLNGSLTPFLFQTRTIQDPPQWLKGTVRRKTGYAASRLANHSDGVKKALNVEPLTPQSRSKKVSIASPHDGTRTHPQQPSAGLGEERSKLRSERIPRSASRESAKPRKSTKHVDGVPFEGTKSNELERPYKSTITREEKEAFARLFNMVLTDSGELQRKVPKQVHTTQDALGSQVGQIGKAKPLAIQDEDFPEHFPGPLKRMAAEASRKVQEKEEEARLRRELEAQALDKVAREKAEAARLLSDPLYQQQVAQKDRIEALLAAADTDVELWSVLETELFSPIQLLDLDKETADNRLMESGRREKAKMSTEQAVINSHREDHIAVITHIYPLILSTALDHLIKSFPGSTLPFCILPRIKRIGRTSYILGASTPLYNEIINQTYRIYADFHRIDELLQEFDPAGLEFDNRTMEILQAIEKAGRRGRQGREGVNSKLFWHMDVVSDGWRKVVEWIPAVRERLEQEVARLAEENARVNAEIYQEKLNQQLTSSDDAECHERNQPEQKAPEEVVAV